MASDEAMHDGARVGERADTIDLKTGPHTHEQEEPKTVRYWCGEVTRYILWVAGPRGETTFDRARRVRSSRERLPAVFRGGCSISWYDACRA